MILNRCQDFCVVLLKWCYYLATKSKRVYGFLSVIYNKCPKKIKEKIYLWLFLTNTKRASNKGFGKAEEETFETM